jgi:hypothetical protein
METAVVNGNVVEVIDYSARPHQRELTDLIVKRAETKQGPQFFVPVDHRRSGKSSSLVNTLIRIASDPRKSMVGQYMYLYPQQNKIREHIWDNPEILTKFLPTSQVSKKDDQRMVLYFRSGSQLIFDGTDENPDKHRGGNGRGYAVDEYDDQQSRIFTEIIRPIVEANKGFVVLSGTPRGVKQLHDAYLAGQDETRELWWSRLLPATVSTNDDGTRLFTDEQLAEIERDYITDGIGAAFAQEYLCSFNQDASQVFRNIDKVCTEKPQEAVPGHSYRIGSDPALTTDYWANSVLDLNTFQEVALERFQPHSTALGEARTEALVRKYNNAELLIDSSGLGLPIADHLRDRGIGVIPLPTGANKERLITNLSIAVDAATVHFTDDSVGKEEFREYSFNRTPMGRYQFSAPEGRHDDTVIARALAVWELGAPMPLPEQGGIVQDLRNSYYGEKARPTNTFYGQNHKPRGA